MMAVYRIDRLFEEQGFQVRTWWSYWDVRAFPVPTPCSRSSFGTWVHRDVIVITSTALEPKCSSSVGHTWSKKHRSGTVETLIANACSAVVLE